MKTIFTIKFRRVGRYQNPFFYIIVANSKNRFVEKIGGVSLSFKKRQVFLNKFSFCYWIFRGAVPTQSVMRFLKMILKC